MTVHRTPPKAPQAVLPATQPNAEPSSSGGNTPDIKFAHLPWLGRDRFISAEGFKNVRGQRVPTRVLQEPHAFAPELPARGRLDGRFIQAGELASGYMWRTVTEEAGPPTTKPANESTSVGKVVTYVGESELAGHRVFAFSRFERPENAEPIDLLAHSQLSADEAFDRLLLNMYGLPEPAIIQIADDGSVYDISPIRPRYQLFLERLYTNYPEVRLAKQAFTQGELATVALPEEPNLNSAPCEVPELPEGANPTDAGRAMRERDRASLEPAKTRLPRNSVGVQIPVQVDETKR